MTVATPVTFTSTKPTWRMSTVELARVVADHRGWTLTGAWLRDEEHRNVGLGWSMVAEEMVLLGWIKAGSGVNWRKASEGRLRRVERTDRGYWRYQS